MTITPMPFKTFQLALDIFNFSEPEMPGGNIADFYTDEGKILIDHGFLTEGAIRTVVPDRHNEGAGLVEPVWNEETRTYQYISFDDGYYVDVPEEDLKTYNLEIGRFVRHIQEIAGLSGEPRSVLKNFLWSIGSFPLGSGKATVFLARRMAAHQSFDDIYDALKRLGGKSPGVVLARDIPTGRHVELPHGFRMLSLDDAMIIEVDRYRLDMDLLESVLTGVTGEVDDLSPVWASPDYDVVRVNGREFTFTGEKQRQLIGILVRAWQRGEKKCRTQVVLENVEASMKANSLAKFFSGRSDWRDLIGYGGGFCWLKT
ncbi:MAG: hypothetical protein HQL90_08330 [Magnetococcales bacterium]|nr:hypothetical protein [Magnetococcales bacterium]